MSVVAWDGKTLVADKQGCSNGLKARMSKAWRLPSGEVFAAVGNMDQALVLRHWYETGALPDKWPAFQASTEWTVIVVANRQGVRYWCQHPYPLELENKFFAWGSGRELALGAMAMGANAERAVEIACEYEVNCGPGLEVFQLDDQRNTQTDKDSILC